jgi:HD-GYP domain-containing protein (c-di-GMP phosphodiesterase class II)
VVLDEADAQVATIPKEAAGAPVDPGGELSERVASKLESLIRSGVMNVRNSGQSVRTTVVQHGRTKYDEKQSEKLASEHAETSEAVGEIIQGVVSGGDLQAQQMSRVTDAYIKNLTADIGNTLAVGLLENQDPTIAQHSLNVAILAMAIGIEMGLDKDNIGTIGTVGLVQDIGMAFVPREIREANRPLTEIEFLEIQKHPIRTANILQRMSEIPDLVTLIAYQSHERPDGSGYPRRRDKKSIHAFARVLLVADSYTAMTAARPYRRPMIPYAAMETIIRQAQQWRVDPPVVRALLHVLSLFPIGSFVTLSDGSVAQVIRSNGEDFTRPIVCRVQDGLGQPVDSNEDSAIVDLAASELTVVQALPTPGRDEVGLMPRQSRIA